MVITAGQREALRRLKPSFLRNVWLSEAATQFVKQASVAAAADGLSGRVVTSTIRLVKAWVRKGLQQQQGMGGYKRLKSFHIELLVLAAARRGVYRVGYVLDLLLQALAVAQGWAQAAADDAKIGRGRLSPAVRFGGLAGERFYSWQQASAVQQFGMWNSSNSSSRSGQPLVVHPVDPTCSVFDQTDAPFELWAEFGRAAELLQQQLMSCSWGAAAVAAIRDGLSSSSSSSSRNASPADVQRRAVLAPVLASADYALNAPKERCFTGYCPRESDREVVQQLKPSLPRNVWLSEAATQFVQQAAVAAAADGLSGRVVTSTIRLVKAWVRKGLQRQPRMQGYKRLRSFQIELLVLHAAERLAGGSSSSTAAAAAAAGSGYCGEYVLDLLLEALQVAQDWAAAAAAAGRFCQPVMFVELAGARYYSRQQAEALEQCGILRSSSSSSSRVGQPLVVHPVDPTCSVFDQTDAPFELWGEFGRAARLLQRQLLSCSWGEIMWDSSLSAVVA
ncbi:hypothetical protein OEZ85_000339 [Tetradesmus obliquus]|uniref:Dilute domain-containing protein n=1 Tax=Tetradesmus obliquus TaxID=3088 RepID=A0ABY8UPZ1_TETOB|nr:hypothetical protein OEZ85_000339 [Tetradesmus obliquus]